VVGNDKKIEPLNKLWVIKWLYLSLFFDIFANSSQSMPLDKILILWYTYLLNDEMGDKSENKLRIQ